VKILIGGGGGGPSEYMTVKGGLGLVLVQKEQKPVCVCSHVVTAASNVGDL
jgi:hypothetical protein